MSIFKLFIKSKAAPASAARDRLQVLLAHERAYAGTDLVAVLREEIIAVIAKHIQVDQDRVQVKMDRDAHVSTLEIDVEIPLNTSQAA